MARPAQVVMLTPGELDEIQLILRSTKVESRISELSKIT